MSKLSKAEQETIVRFDREGTAATVYTAAESVKRKLSRKGYVFGAMPGGGYQATVPLRCISFRRNEPQKRRKGGFSRKRTPDELAWAAATGGDLSL